MATVRTGLRNIRESTSLMRGGQSAAVLANEVRDAPKDDVASPRELFLGLDKFGIPVTIKLPSAAPRVIG